MTEFAETSEVPFDDKNVLNIVIFGEAGVGKSTFVNAFVNYLKYNSLIEASNGKLLCPIPVKFRFTTDDFEEKIIKIGESENEIPGEGVSSTQNPKSYILKIPEKNITIRLIDTPGIGDTRGLKYDETNTEKILALLGELDHVNALVVMLKPNNSRFTILFEHCVQHLLSKLDKKVFQNFVFVFTNARASFYTPGDTYLPLKTMLEKNSSNAHRILFDKNNTFCIDNESIRYLAAKDQGIQFSNDDINDYSESWTKSSDAIRKMIDYIKSLEPVSMLGTMSINDARRTIFKLASPIIDVIEKCEESKEFLLQHQRKLVENENSLDDLKSLLIIPVPRYHVTENTVKTDTPHKKKYDGFKFSWKPPFISYNFGVEKSIKYKTIITTVTTPYTSYEEAANIKPLVNEREDLKRTLDSATKQLKANIEEYETEAKMLIDAMGHFTVFLKENAFVYGNDFLKSELVNLINREKRTDLTSQRLKNYEGLLLVYLDKVEEVSGVTPEKIRDIKNSLVSQKHFGEYLKFLYEKKVEASDVALSL